ncbi:MAG TPA: glutamyl-tRNA reductase [bacterium]|nr:glutamyl-tRNA reductase [bacterium]
MQFSEVENPEDRGASRGRGRGSARSAGARTTGVRARRYVVAGVSYHELPVAQRELVAVDAAALPGALRAMRGREGVDEAVLLSTCNRVEWYLAGREPRAAVAAAEAFFAERIAPSGDRQASAARVAIGNDAVRHAFRVASGLDSMVVGESQILGQVRAAFAAGRAAGTVGPSLDALFRSALAAGRRVRREMDVSRFAASVPSAAVAHAGRLLGSLAGRRVLVVGAGKMGKTTVRAMVDAGANAVVVANRTVETARDIAAVVGAEIASLDGVGAELARADVAIVSTGAPGIILDAAAVAGACHGRRTPLVIIDIAVPRNVDPAVGCVPGVQLYDIDDLIEPSRQQGAGATGLRQAEAFIEEDVQAFLRARADRKVAPLIAEARADADAILEREWNRARGRLASLDDGEEAVVRAVLRRVANKLLHRPIATLLAAAKAGGPGLDSASDDVEDAR